LTRGPAMTGRTMLRRMVIRLFLGRG